LMRALALLLTLLSYSVSSSADSKDEDAAKEAAVNFAKALKAKKIDDLMMTVDVPFAWLIDDPSLKPYEKTEDLKKMIQSKLDNIKDTSGIATDISKVLDSAAILKLSQGKKDSGAIEKAIGDNGFCLILGKNGKSETPLLVRIKDGKAKVVGMMK